MRCRTSRSARTRRAIAIPSFLNSPSFDGFPPDLLESLKPVAANLFDGAAEVKQTLYSFKVGRALKAARLARTLGQEEARRVRQAIALEAVRAYNSLLLMIEYVRINQRTLEQKNEHLTSVRNRRAAGVATELDVLRSEVDVENQRALLTRAEGRVDLARATLNAVMLRPINAPIEPTDTLEGAPLPQTLEQALAAAVAERPEVKSAAIDEKVREEIVAIERAERMPVFDFNAAYGWNVREPRQLLPQRLLQVDRRRRRHRADLRWRPLEGTHRAGAGRTRQGRAVAAGG